MIENYFRSKVVSYKILLRLALAIAIPRTASCHSENVARIGSLAICQRFELLYPKDVSFQADSTLEIGDTRA
jgi:hypothetical protein